MFGWLKKLFRRGKQAENFSETKQEAAYVESAPAPVQEQPARLAPHSSSEPDRPEKACPKCGSPNDKFVHKCWMCKTEI